MSNDNFPKVFRPAQIEDFLICAKDASEFTGPGNEIFADAHIEAVLEEVKASEADLTAARVSIEQYLINELTKDPDNVIFMRMSDNFQPIFQKVIDVEIKMFGAPKFVVSKNHNNATAWRLDSASEVPISNVSLPQDVLTEVSKYGFTSVLAADYILPDQPKDPYEVRREFFDELPIEGDDTLQKERDWLEKFESEALFEFIDRLVFICNFHDQVSTLITKQLFIYCTKNELHGAKRDEKVIEYEQSCPTPEPELAPEKFIVTAANASKRSLFTLLHISGEKRKDFVDSVKTKIDWLREEYECPANHFNNDLDQSYPDDYIIERGVEEAFAGMVKMYGKHPIFPEDMTGIKLVLEFIDEDQLRHFYLCYNDLISYYEERHFFESASTCNLLKEFIATIGAMDDEPTEAEIEVMNEEAMEKRANGFGSSIFIE